VKAPDLVISSLTGLFSKSEGCRVNGDLSFADEPVELLAGQRTWVAVLILEDHNAGIRPILEITPEFGSDFDAAALQVSQ
jgi:hypothetical protein